MKTSKILLCAALLGAALTTGCGSDAVKDALASGGQDAGSSTVDVTTDSETIGGMTDAEKDGVCSTVANAVNSGVSLYEKCDIGGLTAAATAAAEGLEAVRDRCKTAVDTCQAGAAAGGSAAEDQVPTIELKGCSLFKGDVAACDKPISLLETCLSDMAQAAVATVVGLACDTLTLDGLTSNGLDTLGAAVPETPACGELQLACPGVFGPGGGGGADDASVGPDAGTPAGDAAAPAGDAAAAATDAAAPATDAHAGH